MFVRLAFNRKFTWPIESLARILSMVKDVSQSGIDLPFVEFV